ncbi:MAG TPA: right-handed parallel beta-helix repeat-containing protein, partial [Anaerolineae bacterium]|nr:right-handed parallel beta-helix repeat-containing protein [Anaerolineae bacterium]
MKFRHLVFLMAVVLGVGAALSLTTHLTQAKAAGGTVTTCDDAHLAAALSGGGLVTFNCGPATLTVTSLKTIAVDTTIDGSNNGQPLTLTAASSVQLFSINAGIGLTLTHLTIANLNSGFQFPIYNNGGRVNVSNSHFYNNLTGVFQSYGPMTVTQSVFTGTAAMEAIYMGSGVALQVSNSQFISNTYGAISSQGPVVIDNSQFDDNLRPVNNGAVYMRYSVGIGGGPLTVTNSSFVGNTGGAIVSYGGSILINSTNFFSNIIGFAGSGLFFQSSSITDVVQIINSTFEGNHGGALSTNSGNATFKIVNSQFINNLGGDSAVDVPYMIGVTILDSSFVGNVTPNNNWPGALLLST